MQQITIIGAGLAGAEAAWQAAELGVQVNLCEMRPKVSTPAHHTGLFAELVCSNSLRSNQLENAVGLLKQEMRELKSLIMRCADATQVPAGGALAVDREVFSEMVTHCIKNHPNIHVCEQEVTEIKPDTITIVASGPLTSGKLSDRIQRLTGNDYFYFYDAAAPIIVAESIDMNKVFRSSRYDKGDADYLNCPMNEEEYYRFYEALIAAEVAELKAFEKAVFFEGCMPVEVMARRGRDTLRFGPLKPVGLVDPATGQMPYAVVQLRQDNSAASLYNIVGFQTHLKWPEQKRVFGLIPGLENAEFARYGVMHRNTFINSPKVLNPTMQMKSLPNVLFAGQITGVEGYIESAASGLVAGMNAAKMAKNEKPLLFPIETAHGALCHYITTADSKHFQPMNINFGLLPPLEVKIRDKRLKNKSIAERALTTIKQFKKF